MDIYFKNTKLEKEFSEEKRLERVHGSLRAKKIRIRLTEFRAASTLYDFWPPKSGPGRCHELTGDLKGYLSVDLDHPYRLIFAPLNAPEENPDSADARLKVSIPLKPDGGLDWKQVTAIMITGIEDTHE